MQVVNAAPTAAPDVRPTAGGTHTTFQVAASGSADLEDPVAALEVRWDHNGDGTYDSAWSTAKTADVSYADPGTYMVGVEVRDTAGLTDTTARQVTVMAERFLYLPFVRG